MGPSTSLTTTEFTPLPRREYTEVLHLNGLASRGGRTRRDSAAAAMHFTPRVAPFDKRVLAGVIDGSVLLVVGGAALLTPLFLRAVTLPMWAVLAVLIGVSVVPLVAFKRTLGLHVMGLELVGARGHALDPANALFRELLGRGFFPAAYLFTLGAGLVAQRYGVGASTAPPVLAGLMTVACSIALMVALVGHVVAFGRADRKTLADLLSGSVVVLAPALPLPTDPDELDELAARRRQVLRNVVIVEALVVLSVAGLPFLLSSAGGETTAQKIQRLKIEALKVKFDANPVSQSLSDELERELENAGRTVDAKDVHERHRVALSLQEVAREESLRARFAESHDRALAQELIALLEQQDRVDEAREVYLDWLGPTPLPSELVGFGNWLATNNKTQEAATVLRQAVDLDPLVPLGHTLLGVCLQRLERLSQAREELQLAVLDDPHDEDAADALRAVEGKLGQLGDRDLKALERRLADWKRDAGSTE